MADVKCLNVKCEKVNPSELTFCRFCGTRLPKQAALEPPSVTGLAALQAANQDLKNKQTQLATDHQLLEEKHQQLLTQTQQIQASHEQLQDQHQQALSQLGELQQREQTVKQQAEGQISGLLAELADVKQRLAGQPANAAAVEGLVAELRQKLTKAEQDLQVAAGEIQRFKTSPVGQITQPLWVKLVSWGLLPLIGSAGGLAIGTYSGVSASKAKLDQTLNGKSLQARQLESLQAQLATLRQLLEQKQQQLALAQQNGVQANTQLSDAQRSSQASAAQLTADKGALTNAKAEIARDRALIAEKEQQLQTAQSANQQLTARAAQASALQDIINRHPSLNYKGPAQGMVTVSYSAHNDKPSRIAIDHFRVVSRESDLNNVTIQSVAGSAFPTVPFIVEPASNNTTIVSPPGPANGWQKVIISVHGKGSSQAVLRWFVF